MRGENPASGDQKTSGRIALLPPDLIDQIAAGEVVERPASVVKELVENALDAGASRIRVEVRDGGTSVIGITDDGCGMTPSEAALALQRHATSKLQTLSDLSRITSFGFRGEALPAIASVSRLRLITRARDAESAHEIRVEGGRLQVERAAGAPEGTRIEVANLFFNVPARRKFLKKPGTEWGHIADWLGRLGLALPGIHFEVIRDDRESIVWPATSTGQDRVAAVLSERVASGLIHVEWEEGAGHVDAWLSGPDTTRANAAGLYLFVNGRPVRDKLLRHAVLDAYRDVLPRGRYPTAIVFLTLPPLDVDVNVHPAKWEVRFAEPRAIHQLVRHAVREAMSGRQWLGAAGEGAHRVAPSPDGNAHTAASSDPNDWIFAGRRAQSPPLLFRDRPISDGSSGTDGAIPAETATNHAAAEDDSHRLHFGSMRLIGQMLASYLILETPGGMLLVDQHAAHERILYERLRASWLEQDVPQQGLLVPLNVELEPLALDALLEATSVTEQLGFDLEAFGESAVMVRALPALLAGRDPAGLVRELAEELERGEAPPEATTANTRLIAAVDRIFATLACHSARRFGDHLEPAEQRAILEGLDEIPWAPTCPHGRPVAAPLSKADIERRFARR